MDRETCQLTSLRLSRVLEDIGVSEWMITKRRKMWLMAETLCDTAFCNILGVDAFFHHFGSQSEGSTTPGMTSDVDMLAYTDECCVIQDWSEWQPQKINHLVFKNERIPPQHCYIQAHLPPH
ncbi:uncharacterized protein LOC128209523 [Mya arenaria]|uniref:uncharacterized protein LOC128209523 n=1 Tax=Mya arenaria TaxID=6604 RepID=UPI0022E54540|nr:uncharacterized protein LOC128209523 [Mya arenaria]